MTRSRWLVLATCVRPGGQGGGVVRYTTELLAALARRPDVALTVLGERGSEAALGAATRGGARIVVPPLSVPAAAGAVLEREHPLAAHGFDVVLGTKHIVPRRTSAVRLLTVHDMLLLDRPADFPLGKRLLLPRPYRRSIAVADVPICVSAATRARLRRHDPAAADRAVVVPLATASALRAAVPEPVPALDGRRFALVVGDGSPRKNLHTVVRAWAAVRASVPDVVLAIAGPPDWSGSGPDEDRAALVAGGGAVALGHLPDTQLRWCFDRAEVVLCPSIVEGFGLPVAEALDFGAPVVVSDDPALCEVAAGHQVATVPWRDQHGWAAAAIGALQQGRRPAGGRSRRSWDDVAEETVRAARDRAGQPAQPASSAPAASPYDHQT